MTSEGAAGCNWDCGSYRDRGSAVSSARGFSWRERWRRRKAGGGVISFLIAGIASAAAALSYAEFAGMIPKAGSAYTYGYAVLGEMGGLVIGWDLLLEYTAIVAVVEIGISGYLGVLIGEDRADLTQWMLGARPETGRRAPGRPVRGGACLLIAFVLNRGMRAARRARDESWCAQGRDGLLVVVVGAFYMNTDNTTVVPFGLGGASRSAMVSSRLRLRRDEHGGGGVEGGATALPKAILTRWRSRWCSTCWPAWCSPACRLRRDRRGERLARGVREGGAAAGSARSDRRRRDRRDRDGACSRSCSGVTRVWLRDEPRRAAARSGSRSTARSTPRADPRDLDRRESASALIAGLLRIGEAAELTNIGILLAFVVVCVAVVVLRYRRPELRAHVPMPVCRDAADRRRFSIWLISYLDR